MIVSDIATRALDSGWELSARVWRAAGSGGEWFVWFRLPGPLGPPPLTADPFVAAFLIPCMYLKEDLRVTAPVSPRLLAACGKIQDMMTRWHPDLGRVAVHCEEIRSDAPRIAPGATACYFTAGIDSTYTALRRRGEIDRLILVWGHDVRIDRPRHWESVVAAIRPAAARLGLPLDIVQTNLRDVGDLHRRGAGRAGPPSFWPRCYLGSFLAAIGHALSGGLDRLIVPASVSYSQTEVYGSNPLLDPLWSSERLEIEHDGCERDRFEKTAWLAEHDRASALSIRVCYSNPESGENCGTCHKCRMHMLSLRALGLLEESESTPRTIDLKEVARGAPKGNTDIFHVPILRAARARGDEETARAIEIAIGRRFSLYRGWHAAGSRARAACQSILPRRVARSVEKRLSGWGLLK